MRRAGPALLLCALVLPAVGCTDDQLYGSLSRIYRLDYDSVRARQYDSELAVEYVDVRGGVPVRVSLHTAEAAPEPGGEYDLVALGDVSGVLSDGTQIPRMVEGTLRLSEYSPAPDGRVAGTFDARMDAGRDILGLTGSFDTSIEQVTWPPARP